MLPIFYGRATVLAEHLSAQGKAYRGEIVLGWASTTDDSEGELTQVGVYRPLDQAMVAGALEGFLGETEQAPPAFSAVKLEGERSYDLARRGAAPQPAPRRVRLDSVTLLSLEREGESSVATVELECGPGFYVRALARDVGRALGSAGYLRRLCRTRVGPLSISESIDLEEAESLGPEVEARLLPATAAVRGLLEVPVLPIDEGRLAHGMEIESRVPGSGLAYAHGEGDRVLAVGEVFGGRFHPRRLVEVG